MAGAAAMPPMLVFLLAQRYFIRGIQSTGFR
jgi:ABC-type glycerol-3-phosphate transport system permease component